MALSRSGNPVPLPPPPDREEWDFESVPEEELEACALWEYARESSWVRDLKVRCSRPGTLKMLPRKAHEFVGVDIERLQGDWNACYVLCPGLFFRPQRKPGHSGITGRFPDPWQSLSRMERQTRAAIPSLKQELRAAPFCRGHSGEAKWLAEFGAEFVARGSPSEDIRPGWQPGQSFYMAGAEHGVFEIGWDCFTNDEIVKGFAAWVKANRPSHMPGPDGRGRRKHDWRVQLKRLGIMRLLHRCPLKLVKPWCPAAWKRYGRLDWYKERRRALGHFRQWLWMLPEGEEPLSWTGAADRAS